MQLAFFNADRSRSGHAILDEVLISLQVAGFSVSHNTIHNILTRLETENEGVLSWDIFLQVITYLAVSRAVFDWLDIDNTGKIQLDFDKFANYTSYLKL